MGKTTPTVRQKKAFDIAVENGGNISKAMREAGYSPETAKNPKEKLTASKSWEQLMEEHLPDSLLSKVHEEGLKATKQVGQYADIEVDDIPTRHKYLDTAYKLKAKFEKDNKQKQTQINITTEQKEANNEALKDL